MQTRGKIHSLESFGTVDGPGLRFVVFMQGCPLRCLYCHNPDTWDVRSPAKIELTAEELLQEILKYKSFITKGGVTITGGEPLLQAEFIKELFQLCKQQAIHTALDTSGALLNEKVKEVLQYTDLVLLDIKSVNPHLHQTLTGVRQETPLLFLNYLEEKKINTWIRHVIVPGYTDKEDDLEKLAIFLSKYKTIRKVELLPYHTLGLSKYKQLGLDYKLRDTPPLSPEKLNIARVIFEKYSLPLK